MRGRLAAIAVLGLACGGSSHGGASDAAAGRDGAASDGAVGDTSGAIDGSGSGSAASIPTYGTTPTQTLLPPAGADEAYGIIAAISADGLTLASFDRKKLYIFTRATGSAAFDATPSQVLAPANVSNLGTGLSLSADGALLACGASGSAAEDEILVFARAGSGSAYAATPQAIPATTNYSEVAISALSPDADELVTQGGSGDSILVLPRAGSAFSTSPTQTIAKPANASEFYGAVGSVATDGTFAIADLQGGSGLGVIDVYSGTPTVDPTPVAIESPNGEHDFGTSLSLRADAVELAEGSITPGEVDIFASDGSGGWTAGQILDAPSGAGGFGISVSLAADGTLVANDYGAHIYIFAPQ